MSQRLEPDQRSIRLLHEGRVSAAVATEVILSRGIPRAEAPAQQQEAMDADERRVFGNRNLDTVLVTWDDARYLLAATLRRCLERLEVGEYD